MAAFPPLQVWGYSVALAAGTVGLFAWLTWIPADVQGNAVAMYTRQFLDEQAHNVRVIGIGSSLLWAATPPAIQPKLKGLAWMRLTKPGPGLGYLQASVDLMEQHPPDILVIEQNLLLPDVDNMGMTQLRQELALRIIDGASKLVGRSDGTPAQAYLPLVDQRESFQCKLAPSHLRSKKTLELQTLFTSGTVDRPLSSKLLRMAASGVHIILLEIRRSTSLEQGITQQKLRWQQHLRQILPPGPHITYLVSPDVMRENMFCDGSHMNEAGARVFSAWWQAQLPQLTTGH